MDTIYRPLTRTPFSQTRYQQRMTAMYSSQLISIPPCCSFFSIPHPSLPTSIEQKRHANRSLSHRRKKQRERRPNISVRDRTYKAAHDQGANEENATVSRSILPAEDARVDNEIDVGRRDHSGGDLWNVDGACQGDFCGQNGESVLALIIMNG